MQGIIGPKITFMLDNGNFIEVGIPDIAAVEKTGESELRVDLEVVLSDQGVRLLPPGYLFDIDDKEGFLQVKADKQSFSRFLDESGKSLVQLPVIPDLEEYPSDVLLDEVENGGVYINPLEIAIVTYQEPVTFVGLRTKFVRYINLPLEEFFEKVKIPFSEIPVGDRGQKIYVNPPCPENFLELFLKFAASAPDEDDPGIHEQTLELLN